MTMTSRGQTQTVTTPGWQVSTLAGQGPTAPVLAPRGAFSEQMRMLEGPGGRPTDGTADRAAQKSGFADRNSGKGPDFRGPIHGGPGPRNGDRMGSRPMNDPFLRLPPPGMGICRRRGKRAGCQPRPVAARKSFRPHGPAGTRASQRTETIMARLTSTADLRRVIAEPRPATRSKVLDALDEQSIDFLKRCPFALVSTTAADGTIEVSPKGDEPGFHPHRGSRGRC